MAKFFVGKKVQQAIIVNNSKELNIFVKSIRTEVDGFMLREFIESDAISCIVIGKKIFAIKRKNNDGSVEELTQGKTVKLSENEEETVISASQASGFDIARIDIAKGRVLKVEPLIPINEFNSICSERIEEHVANFLIEKATQHENKKRIIYDFLGIKKLFSKTIFGRFFK